MADYQPFLISAYRTGYFTYLQPWIGPTEAFETIENAFVYRGTLTKRNGYNQLGNQLGDHKPVMGILNFIDETTGDETLIVCSEQNAYKYNTGTGNFDLLTSILDSLFWQGTTAAAGATIPTVGTIPLFWPNLTAGTVVVKAYLASNPTMLYDQVTDNGAGAWGAPTTGNLFAAGGSINYTTGAVSFLTGGAAAPINAPNYVILKVTATTTGNYFTGNITNFFNFTNWQPTDPATFVTSTSYLYMTNNVDPITLFNGTNLSRPVFYINDVTVGFTQYIKKALDVQVYKNRLLFIKPTLNNSANPLNQSVFYSALFNPFNVITNITGNGGSLTAATSDIIQSFNFLRDSAIIRFSRSVYIFRFTGNDFNPFVFVKINATKRTNCPYASIEFDERETGIGGTGITATDGVNVQRVDVNIVDFYETEMAEAFYNQAFSKRYDNQQQAWTLYVSSENEFPDVDSLAPGSDKALILNFLENTWCTFKFSIPTTCLGTYHVLTGKTWADMTIEWQNADLPWFSYSTQLKAPNILVGDTTGHVYWFDNALTVDDNGTAIKATMLTNKWNPFVSIGQKIQFGYIDFYYRVNDEVVMNLDFFLNNSDTPDQSQSFTMRADGADGAADSPFAMHRVYINGMGEFLQMQMTSDSNGPFQILGMVLWARPAGRLTP